MVWKNSLLFWPDFYTFPAADRIKVLPSYSLHWPSSEKWRHLLVQISCVCRAKRNFLASFHISSIFHQGIQGSSLLFSRTLIVIVNYLSWKINIEFCSPKRTLQVFLHDAKQSSSVTGKCPRSSSTCMLRFSWGTRSRPRFPRCGSWKSWTFLLPVLVNCSPVCALMHGKYCLLCRGLSPRGLSMRRMKKKRSQRVVVMQPSHQVSCWGARVGPSCAIREKTNQTYGSKSHAVLRYSVFSFRVTQFTVQYEEGGKMVPFVFFGVEKRVHCIFRGSKIRFLWICIPSRWCWRISLR